MCVTYSKQNIATSRWFLRIHINNTGLFSNHWINNTYFVYKQLRGISIFFTYTFPTEVNKYSSEMQKKQDPYPPATRWTMVWYCDMPSKYKILAWKYSIENKICCKQSTEVDWMRLKIEEFHTHAYYQKKRRTQLWQGCLDRKLQIAPTR